MPPAIEEKDNDVMLPEQGNDNPPRVTKQTLHDAIGELSIVTPCPSLDEKKKPSPEKGANAGRPLVRKFENEGWLLLEIAKAATAADLKAVQLRSEEWVPKGTQGQERAFRLLGTSVLSLVLGRKLLLDIHLAPRSVIEPQVTRYQVSQLKTECL